ncbi:MAG: sigma-70 family RNA polymerase sigma factor [Rhizobium sp.]|nr:MAG: sigma-70 family RNA polymerase sigma factor [Rhizobium sp.]
MSLQLDFSSPGELPALQDFVEWRELPEPPQDRATAVTCNDASEETLAELLGKIASGDASAFTELHRHFRPLMFRVALRVLHNHELAEETVQDALLKIWQCSAQFNATRGKARAWIAVITRNQALDRIRQKRLPELSIDEQYLDVPDSIDMTAEPMDVVDMLNTLAFFGDVLAIMPSRMRQSVLMSCYEGYSHTEIAEHMQAPVGTVKAWIRRGLQKLRASAESEGPMHFANA